MFGPFPLSGSITFRIYRRRCSSVHLALFTGDPRTQRPPFDRTLCRSATWTIYELASLRVYTYPLPFVYRLFDMSCSIFFFGLAPVSIPLPPLISTTPTCRLISASVFFRLRLLSPESYQTTKAHKNITHLLFPCSHLTSAILIFLPHHGYSILTASPPPPFCRMNAHIHLLIRVVPPPPPHIHTYRFPLTLLQTVPLVSLEILVGK